MRFKKTRLVTLLVAMSMLDPFVACEKIPDKQTEQTKPDDAYYEVFDESETQKEIQNVIDKVTENEILTLSDIKPTFSPYKNHLAMDEQSVLNIIKIAMKDAQKFFVDMGAPNMTYDKNLNIVAGEDNFYPEWMDEHFYLAKAMAESSFRVDVITDIKENEADNDAHGILQICPQGLKDTLEQYYRDIFGVNYDLSELEVVPSREDVEQAYYSKTAQQNIVKAVYNNIYLAICYDIYNVKCLNPVSHRDYYAKYGGFDDSIRRLATIGLYGTKRAVVLNGLRNGTLEEDLRRIKDIDIYLNNIAENERVYDVKYAQENINQPER